MAGQFGLFIGGMLAVIPSLLTTLFRSLGVQPLVSLFDGIVAALIQ
jgi:hypothetical protein